jgi:Fe-S cluster biogenesis protein NfuA
MSAPFQVVNLYTESTPNPETMKFVTNRLLSSEVLNFTSIKEADESPLALRLFDFSFVKAIFISQNYVTITKSDEDDWDELIPVAKDFIKNYLEAGLPIFEKKKVNLEGEEDDQSPIALKIKDILRTYIQPAVEQDGGAIFFKHFEPTSGIVTVSLQGSCKGCPSSIITLKSGIENMLKRMIPEVTEVVSEG